METNQSNAENSNPYIQKIIPAVLYHGTDAVFENFDKSFLGSHTVYQNTVHGFFFTDLVKHAEMFGSRIITVSLEMQKPLDLTIQGIFNCEEQASVIWEAISGEKLEAQEALETLNEEIGPGNVDDMYDWLHSEDANQLFRKSGFDGIISSLGGGYLEYIPFDVCQINVFKEPE